MSPRSSKRTVPSDAVICTLRLQLPGLRAQPQARRSQRDAGRMDAVQAQRLEQTNRTLEFQALRAHVRTSKVCETAHDEMWALFRVSQRVWAGPFVIQKLFLAVTFSDVFNFL